MHNIHQGPIIPMYESMKSIFGYKIYEYVIRRILNYFKTTYYFNQPQWFRLDKS